MKGQSWRRVLAVAATLGLALTACGGDDDEASDATDVPSATTAAGEGGGDTTAAPTGETTELTILGTLKPEIAEQFEAAVGAYNASQSTYSLEIVPLPVGEFMQTATSMYASGNAPTLMVMSQEIPEFQDRLLDLSGTEMVGNALPGTLNQATLADGRIIGVPQTIEAYGLLYNQAVLDEAVGGTFDPASVTTRSELADVLAKVDALESTDAAVHVSPMDWSLGAHLTNMMYSPRSDDRAERLAFFEQLKAGDVDLGADELFNGWMDTVDLLLANNQLADSPLDAEYDDGVAALASGKVGFWFMGNWALPNLAEANPDGSFGVIPVPVSDDPADYGNAQISIGVPAYLVVDAEQSSAEQQAGAIDFLTWLTTSDEGLDFYVNEFKFLPAYDTVEAPPADSLSQQILAYASSGNSLEWMNSLYPADGWPTFGASMQQYVSGDIDRATLAEQFAGYWPTVK